MRIWLGARLLPGMVAAASLSVAAAGQGTDQEAIEALKALGQPVFETSCSSCHGKAGGGFVGPSLAGNDRIGESSLVFRQILHGSDDMPPFRDKLTPEEIVAVGTYIRNSWGNDYGILVAEDGPSQ